MIDQAEMQALIGKPELNGTYALANESTLYFVSKAS